MKDIDEYKESGVPWIDEIPKDWEALGFKRVFEVIYRYPTYYNIEYVSEGVPEVRGEALNNNGLITRLDSERYISVETNAMFPRTQLAKDDIVMSVRGTMGKIGLVDDRYVGANITANLLRLSLKSSVVDGQFLKWFFVSEYFHQNLEAGSPLTTIKTITMPQLAKIFLIIPPLQEQHRIAIYLDKICAAIDGTIEAKRKQLETLDALRKSVIHKAVTRGLDDSVSLKDSGVEWIGKIPKHWRISGFKRVFKVIYRYPTYYNIEYMSEGVPEIRGEALNSDGLITKLESERYISPETNALFQRTQLSKGDVVMSVRGTMGKIGLIDDHYVGANITANLLRLSPKSRIVDGRFLRWFFMSEYFLQSLAATSPQTTIKTITMPQLAKIPLLIGPISEQIVIAEYLDVRITEIKMLKDNLNNQIKVLNQYRKSLIHECVTGKRRITDNDLKQIEVKLN